MTSGFRSLIRGVLGGETPSASSTPRVVPMEEMHGEFYLQRDRVSDEYAGLSRIEIFSRYCQGKRVLHIGCTQYPITNIETSLHVALSAVCDTIDGFDVDRSGYEVLAPHVKNGRFLDTLADADEYDVVIIPEVLEHVGDVSGFLAGISSVRSEHYIVTVPDVYQCMARHFRVERSGQQCQVIEAVHPDHNYWFTPFTLRNTLKKYTSWRVESLYFINNISLMAVCKRG